MLVHSRFHCLYVVFYAVLFALFISSSRAPVRADELVNNVGNTNNDCAEIEKQSSDEFPPDIFTPEQRSHGAILVHLFVLLYCFVFIAMVCENYFLPSVFCICEDLKITPDIAGATFMASATSFPEMSVNVIATFVTKSDLGIGTIVGGTVCNTLAVAGIAGLASSKSIKLKPSPLLRDSIIHLSVITMLAFILMDGIIDWSEALVLVVSYFIYFAVMLTHKRILSFIKRNHIFTRFLCQESYTWKINDPKPPKIRTVSEQVFDANTYSTNNAEEHEKADDEKHAISIFWSYFSFPAKKILSVTIPDCKRNARLYPLTFAMCVIWIGVCSYLLCWMVTIFGDTFSIPDVVMGMVFLAIGGSIPEASSAIINAKHGIGTMSVSNTLGANTLDVLLSLGMPWLVKCSLPPAYGGGPIQLETDNLSFDCIGLASSIILLNVIALGTGYHMNKVFGMLCILSYFIIVSIFSLVGLNILTIFGTATNNKC